MLRDLACLAVLCVFLAADRIAVFYRIEPDSLWMYWEWLWGGVCALVFLLYGFSQLQRAPATISRCVGLFGRALVVFCLAVAFGTWFDVLLGPRDRGEWPLAVWGLVVPGVPATVVSLTVGCIIGAARRTI
jgi:hypothetical protein